MDVFYEQIVVKQSTPTDILKKVGLIVAALAVIVLVMFILPVVPEPTIASIFGSIGLFLAAGAIYGTWFLLTSMNVEYEYILTNGEIDIDKIIARRKRKRLVTVNARNFTEMGKYSPAQHKGKSYPATIMACTNPEAEDCWYAVADHPKHGSCLLVFNPNEHIRSGMKQYVKRAALKDDLV